MPTLEPAQIALLAGAALVAGAVNAVAGGGSLLSFPALLAVGYPALTANVTNTVALTPGYFGGPSATGASSRASGAGPSPSAPSAPSGPCSAPTCC